ncbi:flagellar motor protein MotB [Paraburkholderia bannensis]|uniref:Flagellar motor protein MotB n=2 Tax=Burkholderiaceae TaxID=119060 RepID=A0A7W9U133_9BURK|nr:flagellar motor protein MotB [Paraburkholderia sp. WP4_3_2]MBB6103985.1 flagellar motor protein MotB [Paraburkholderia bannensis]
MHAKFIRPFVQTNKTDAADARAIWTAIQQPGMRTVATKTEDQQAMLGLHRMRSLLVKFRTMQVNQLRGLLYEFGASFRTGRVAGLNEIRARMVELGDTLPGIMISCLQDQLRRVDGIEQNIDQLEKQIGAWHKHEAACRAIAEVPGIGRLTATALVATIGDAKTFKSGREFASFLGLVPRQSCQRRLNPDPRSVLHAPQQSDGIRRLEAMRARLVAASPAGNTAANTCTERHAQAPHQDTGTVRGSKNAPVGSPSQQPEETTLCRNVESVHHGARATGPTIETTARPRGAQAAAPLSPDDFVDVKYRETAQTVPVRRRWGARACWFVAGVIAAALLSALAYRIHVGAAGSVVTPASPLAGIVHAIDGGLSGEIASHSITLRTNAGMSSLVILIEGMFGPGQATLSPSSVPVIAQIGRTLAAAGSRVQIRLTGYTDNVAPDPTPGVSNLSLSTQRAQAVMQALVLAGVAPGRMNAGGQGEMSPLDDNRTREGRARNRRVEIIVEPAP